MLLGIVEQAGADAHLIVVALEDVEMAAALTALPKFRIVSEFRVGNGAEAELVVHLHNGGAGSDREDLGVREETAGEQEGLFLDAPGDAHSAELVRDNQAGVGDESLVPPGLDVGESGELAFIGKGDDGFTGIDFLDDVFRRAFGDTGLAFQRGDIDLFANLLGVFSVLRFGDVNLDFHTTTNKNLCNLRRFAVKCKI